MAKGILEFNLDEPYDRNGFKRASNATNAYIVLFNVVQDIFRPARKHGYGYLNNNTPEFMNIENWSEQTHNVVGELERLFHELMEGHEVNLNDLE